jgi:hypothetical protein
LGKNSRNQRVVMHEIAHTLGIGTSAGLGLLMKNGVFTGKYATQALREVTHDEKAELHGDRSHDASYEFEQLPKHAELMTIWLAGGSAF